MVITPRKTPLLYLYSFNQKVSTSWNVDYACLLQMFPEKKYFDTYKACEATTVMMDISYASRVIGIGTVKMNMFDGTVRTLVNVRHVRRLRRGLISLGVLL